MKLMGHELEPFQPSQLRDGFRRGTPEGSPIATPRTLGGPADPTVYTPSPMIKPRVDKLLVHADSHYAAVVVSAKRARQINSYFHNLGEGGFGEYPPPMVETNAEGNYLTMALEELAEGKLKYEYRS
jgi:DNA-directed RNA polymerase subunit omega